MLVARPEFMFGNSIFYDDCGQIVEEKTRLAADLSKASYVIIGIVGAIASACTNFIVRKLTDVHALTTVLYLVCWGLPISPIATALLQTPVWPRGVWTWTSIAGICILGFLGQWFKTQGLKWERAGRWQLDAKSLICCLHLYFRYIFLTCLHPQLVLQRLS